MKKTFFGFLLAALLGFNPLAQATLWDRGGGLIYDDVLNITWMQDANYAGERMIWDDAMTWASNLVYQGYDDWRLPTTIAGPNEFESGYDGTTNGGFNVKSSEMGYMYYVTLGNKGYYALDGTNPQPGWGLVNTSFKSGGPGGPTVSFQNLQPDIYWSDTAYLYQPNYAWCFYFFNGNQRIHEKSLNPYAWAVRDGDSAPLNEPPTANAGADQIVFDTAILDGSASSDPDGQVVSYAWTLQHRENTKDIRTASGITPTVSTLNPGFYDVTLTVTDNDGATGTDTMLLAVAAPNPNADLDLTSFRITKNKRSNRTTTQMLGTINLPELSVSNGGTVQSRITIELFGVLDGGGDVIMSKEATLTVTETPKTLDIRK